MREIQLTQGKVAQVDDEDFEELNQFKWFARKLRNTYYVGRNSIYVSGEKRKVIDMHCIIIGKLKGLQTDHIDGNGLNNQKNNLRFVTKRQNNQNRKNQIRTSEYPGVCWEKRRKKWRSRITINRIEKHLGYFESEIDAFNVYRQAVNAIGEKVVDFRK